MSLPPHTYSEIKSFVINKRKGMCVLWNHEKQRTLPGKGTEMLMSPHQRWQKQGHVGGGGVGRHDMFIKCNVKKFY